MAIIKTHSQPVDINGIEFDYRDFGDQEIWMLDLKKIDVMGIDIRNNGIVIKGKSKRRDE